MSEKLNNRPFLKNCPFCDSSNIVLMGDENRSFAFCDYCGATGPTPHPIEQTETQAAEKWNRRAEPITVWRVEDPVQRHGLWRNFDGSPADTFDKLTVGKCKSMPMEDDDFYRHDGKQWFAATDSPEKLKEWFCAQDIKELREMGQFVYMFDVKAIRKVSEYEVVFTRDDIIRQVQVDPKSIWEEVD